MHRRMEQRQLRYSLTGILEYIFDCRIHGGGGAWEEGSLFLFSEVGLAGSAGYEDERMNWNVPLNAWSTMIYVIKIYVVKIYVIRIGFSAAGEKCC